MWSPNVTYCGYVICMSQAKRQAPLLHWLNDMRRVRRRRRTARVEGGWAQCFPVLGNDVLHSAFPLRGSWLSEHIPTEPSIKLSMQWPTTPSSQRTHVQHAHLHSLTLSILLVPFFISSLVPCHLPPFRITRPAISLLLNHFQANFSPPKHTHIWFKLNTKRQPITRAGRMVFSGVEKV